MRKLSHKTYLMLPSRRIYIVLIHSKVTMITFCWGLSHAEKSFRTLLRLCWEARASQPSPLDNKDLKTLFREEHCHQYKREPPLQLQLCKFFVTTVNIQTSSLHLVSRPAGKSCQTHTCRCLDQQVLCLSIMPPTRSSSCFFEQSWYTLSDTRK